MKSLFSTFLVSCALGLGLMACRHVPPSLSPAGQIAWKANEAANLMQTVQTVAIGLNAASVLSMGNTRVVVQAIQDGANVLEAAPEGTKATITALLETLAGRLDAAGKSSLSTYVLLLEAFVNTRDLERAVCSAACSDDEIKVVFASTLSHLRAGGQKWLSAH